MNVVGSPFMATMCAFMRTATVQVNIASNYLTAEN